MRLSRRNVLVAAAAAIGPRMAQAAERRRAESERFDVTRLELSIPDLDPAHDGLRIAQLSDIHVGRNTPDGRVIAAVRELNALEPDLVVLTGDFVTSRRDPYSRVGQLLEGIEAPAFAVLGNHDHWSDPSSVARSLERADIPVLRNQHTVERLRGAPVYVVGIDDGVTRNDDVERALAKVPSKATRIVLAHAPPTAEKLPEDAALVCFSGHTHGGHFVVPGLTDGIFRRAGQPYIRGHYRVRGNHLYVNRGLGFGRGGPVVRLNSEPEVTVITLRRSEPSPG